MAQSKATPKSTDYLKKKRQDSNPKKKDRKSAPIRFRTTFRNVVLDAMRSRGWKECSSVEAEVSHSNWDIMWADREWMREVFDRMHLEPHQKVNHFRNHYELTRKDMMARNIKRLKRKLYRNGLIAELEKYNFIPLTYSLPHEYGIFLEEFRKIKTGSNSQWIMKPVGRCQGRGIFLFTKLSDIADWKYQPKYIDSKMGKMDDAEKEEQQQAVERYVVQKYISNPLLIGHKKFDLRIYVLVTSYRPLIVYIYRSGFARFTNSRYSNSRTNLDDASMHLTNAAIQKKEHRSEYGAGNDFKWRIRSMKLYLISQFGEQRVNRLFKEINDAIIGSLIAVKNTMIHDKHCFELYGYDIMIDRDLKAWLIEANAGPSFTASSDDDYLLKFSVLTDSLDIVTDKEGKGPQLTQGGFDLVYNDGNVEYHQRCLITSHLGCNNPSMQKYRKIIRRVKKKKK